MSNKFGNSAALDLQNKLTARLPVEVAMRIRWLQPFMTNQNVTLECLDLDDRAAKAVADKINISLRADSILIRGRPIWAAIETSPARKANVKVWYQNKDVAIGLNNDTALCCVRAMEAWDRTCLVRVGFIDVTTSTWTRNRAAAKASGVRTPFDLGEENKFDEVPQGRAVTPRSENRWRTRMRRLTRITNEAP